MKIDVAFFESLNFRPMTGFDLMAFNGCESVMPMIAESGNVIAILDDDHFEVYDEDGRDLFLGRVERDGNDSFSLIEMGA